MFCKECGERLVEGTRSCPSCGALAPAPALAQTPAQVPPEPGAGAASQTYTGHPVSLDFQNADLRAVLRTFAEISGLNLVIDPTVSGSVDVALRCVADHIEAYAVPFLPKFVDHCQEHLGRCRGYTGAIFIKPGTNVIAQEFVEMFN